MFELKIVQLTAGSWQVHAFDDSNHHHCAAQIWEQAEKKEREKS